MHAIRVGIVEDQALFRQSLAFLIQGQPGFELVMEAENAQLCLEFLDSAGVLPKILLMDIEMPDMDGIALNELIQKKYPFIKVIILSIHSSERLMARMIHSGVSGYLLKNCNKEELFLALSTVATSGFYINQKVLTAIQGNGNCSSLERILSPALPFAITKREKEILILICQEFKAQEIAEKLFISIRTVEGHRNRLLEKTGCKNTAGLVMFAVKYKVFVLPY